MASSGDHGNANLLISLEGGVRDSGQPFQSAITTTRRMGEHWAVQQREGGVSTFNMPFVVTEQVEFFEADNDQVTGQAVTALLDMLDDVDGEAQLVSTYLSILTLMFPGLKVKVLEFMKSRGWGVDIIKLPSQGPEFLINVNIQYDAAKVYIMVGQLLIFPYKAVAQTTYYEFMRRRIQALAGRIGFTISPGDNPTLAVRIEKAAIIRSIVGATNELRSEICTAMLETDASPGTPAVFRNMLAYVLSIISWTEMSAFKFVFDILVVTNSPVLKYRQIFSELIRFKDAVMAVMRQTHPQFFRIYANAHEYRLLERSNFPILFAVAQTLKNENQPSAMNFGGTRDNRPQSNVIAHLVAMHKQSLGPSQERAMTEAIT